ncbi:MAG: hypothetical protein LBH71_01280, partial [Oscillospiraceae bacterium]|nr:hypothetical protein [Oscillospiraceae bacterium]
MPDERITLSKKRNKEVREKRQDNQNGDDPKAIYRIKKSHKRRNLIIVLCVFLLIVVFFVYEIRDNRRLTIDRITVTDANIPEAFDGFKILQISDLYESEWGFEQERLVKFINSIDYDIIVMTGDYLRNPSSDNFGPVLDLLEGLDKSKPVYYILGDRDYQPDGVSLKDYQWKYELLPGSKTPLQEAMEAEGAIYVYPIQKVEKDGERIYLTGRKYKSKQFDDADFDIEQDYVIQVLHKPVDYDVKTRLSDMNSRGIQEIDYNLSLSGHTLGGQYRLPILGALYAQDKGIFPDEKYTDGLHKDSDGRYNYICAGLGAAGPDWQRFRLLDPPQVGL